jgi:hypothetical protein
VEQLLETPSGLERVALIFDPASGAADAETRRAALEQLARGARRSHRPSDPLPVSR